jgi:hypothetical protein
LGAEAKADEVPGLDAIDPSRTPPLAMPSVEVREACMPIVWVEGRRPVMGGRAAEEEDRGARAGRRAEESADADEEAESPPWAAVGLIFSMRRF